MTDMGEQAGRSRAQIKQMINETEITILGMRDVLDRFEKKYPPEQVQRKRERIVVHESILSLLKDIEARARP